MTTETPVPDRRTTRKPNQPTLSEIMIAIDEHAAAHTAWRGHGPQVIAKREAVRALLMLAGVL